MKPAAAAAKKKEKFFGRKLLTKAENVKQYGMKLLYDYKYFPITASLIFLFEIALNVFVISRVRYTEIDWKAYMDEVEGVVNGTFDYFKLKGDTGPLVYPAGFVYVFLLLYYITDKGNNILLAQYIFLAFYLVTLYLLYRIYAISKKAPPYALILCCCISYRIHSIYVLRLFNDPVAIMFFYLSLNLFLDGRWTLGSVLYSVAVSIKMNVLLYAPALLLAYLTLLGVKNTLKQLSVCALVQLVLGFPFLLANPVAYVKRSFDLGRVFLYEWTVNWRFVPQDVFLNGYFHSFLLVVHVSLLAYFAAPMYKYLKSYARLKQLEREVRTQLKSHEQTVDMGSTDQLFLLPFFISNFVGIVCSRSLHYQFYVWYYHTIPFLLWSSTFSNSARLLLLGLVELCWNTYPSTNASSLCLFLCHASLLANLVKKFLHRRKSNN